MQADIGRTYNVDATTIGRLRVVQHCPMDVLLREPQVFARFVRLPTIALAAPN